jgi:hypothetical protein
MRRVSSLESRKFGPLVTNQRLKVQLLTVDALPHGARLLPIASHAAHVHLPAQAPGHA